MNENPLPPESEPTAPGPEPKPFPPERSSPGFGKMFGLGILVMVLSIGLCAAAQNPVPLLLGGLAAFVSLFFKGYRGIFAGYAACFGLLLLGTIIYCSNHPLDIK